MSLTRYDQDDIDWLQSAQPFAVEFAAGETIISCDEGDFDAAFAAEPPIGSLTVRFRRGLTLRCDGDGSLLRGVKLRLVVTGDEAAVCRVDGSVAMVDCDGSRRGGVRRRHRLMAPPSASVEIQSGDWHLEAHPDHEPKPIWLRVPAETESLRIVSDHPVDNLVSGGDHQFDLRAETDPMRVVVTSGTATFRRPLSGAEVLGDGSLRVLSSVTGSLLAVTGSVEVHGDIDDTEIDIGGALEVLGAITITGRKMSCADAIVRGTLAGAGLVECDSLHVAGMVVDLETGARDVGR